MSIRPLSNYERNFLPSALPSCELCPEPTSPGKRLCALHTTFPFTVGMVLAFGGAAFTDPTEKTIAEVDPMRHLVRCEGERTFFDPRHLPNCRVRSTRKRVAEGSPVTFERRTEGKITGTSPTHGEADIGEARGYALLPFQTTPIQAAACCTLSAQPQVPFTPRRLVLGTGCDDLIIRSIVVGQCSQLVCCGPLPGRLFAPLPLGLSNVDRQLFEGLLRMRFDQVDISQYVQVTIENPTVREIVVNATMLGDGDW